MTTIGGRGGVGGPRGPGGPDGPLQVDDVAPADAAPVDAAQATGGASDVDALSAEVAAGRLTPREAIERLVDATAGPGLGATERAELRELLTDLVANDPYLGGLIGRM